MMHEGGVINGRASILLAVEVHILQRADEAAIGNECGLESQID